MLKKLILSILALPLIGSIIGCNSSADDEYEYVASNSVTVTAFSLKDNSKILDSLSNVFFSIDLVNAKIFNAEPLPYGTKVTRLQPNITVAASASAVTLKYYCKEIGRDSIVNYITNSTDSIDFSHGPVILTVTSQSGTVKRDYEIRVNVNDIKTDSLAWYSIESAPLPSDFSKVKAQYTVRLNGTYYCLSTDGASYCLATTDDPADPTWHTDIVTFDFTPNVESLRASSKALYILDADGKLHTSTDCKTWTPTSETWQYIYGAYEDEILGSSVGAQSLICSYPSGKTWAMPSDFPIEGTSETATYSISMGFAPQLVMVGGKLQDGTYSEHTWAFDGNIWAKISKKPLPQGLESISLVPYSLVNTPSSTWTPKSYPVLMAIGGRSAEGAINRVIYYSRDWGMTWHEAPSGIQLTSAVPTLYGASAFEYSTTMYVESRTNVWESLNVKDIPSDCVFELPIASSRATKPLTQWECPAIYLFGGKDYDGETYNTVWRGVILQYTLKPVQ